MLKNSLNKIDIAAEAERLRVDAAGAVIGAEEKYSDALNEAAADALACGARVILLCGPSAAGKTTTSKKLTAYFRERALDAERVSLDNFYRPRSEAPLWEDGEPNFESTDALDLKSYNRCIKKLITEGSADFPVFDFTLGAVGSSFKAKMGDVLIIEGLHALNPLIAEPLDGLPFKKLYISTHSSFVSQGRTVLPAKCLRLERRLLRDMSHRASSLENTCRLWGYVVRGEYEYIMPFRDEADYRIDTAHAYEPFLYSSRLKAGVDKLLTELPEMPELQEIAASASLFPPLSAEVVPQTSLLREFI